MNIILTGGHSGIGLELTKILLAEQHKLGLIIRSEKRKAEAMKELGNPGNIDFFYADLSNQEAVVKVAKEIQEQWGKVDGLFNNAGVLLDKAYTSDQGNEMHYEVNTLAPYLLTNQLQPALEQSEHPFVVNTVTGSLASRKALDMQTLLKPEKFVKLMGSYMQSKLALALLMADKAKEWQAARIVSVNPGPNKTKMTAGSGMPGWLLPIRNLLFPGPKKGAGLLYNGAFDAKFKGQSGIFVSGGKVRPMKITLSAAEKAKVLEGIKVQ